MLSQNLNETRIVGKCEINDEPVKFLVDTGSDNTTISQKTADRCGLTVDSEPVKRLMADGSETNINKVNTKVTFNDKPVVLDVNVLQSLPVDCLLGMDFISRHPATADLYQKLRETFYEQAEREEE
jgi:predicted aspartyl protease